MNMMRFGGFGYSLIGLAVAYLIILCVLALLVLAIIFIVRSLKKPGNMPAHPPIHNTVNNAVNILNERYARGEISDEEYQKKKSEILKS